MKHKTTHEDHRLHETTTGKINWKKWGPYLAERAWGTVREDYSPNGDAWGYFRHDHARSRAYRWNEDGLGGISDDEQRLCFAIALWNGQDAILKERFFGLTGSEGNHGEDVKEYYFYLDSTPTHSYMKMLYKYPQRAFPYTDLVEINRQRGKGMPEYELFDAGIFGENRYFDIFVEYAKADADDILIRITVFNRGPEPADLHILPTLWFRNTWSWGWEHDQIPRPALKETSSGDIAKWMEVQHATLGKYLFACEGADALVFTENETNSERLFGSPNATAYVKDAFHAYVIEGRKGAVNPTQVGTKAAVVYHYNIAAGESVSVRLRLMKVEHPDRHLRQAEASSPVGPFTSFDEIFARRESEADEFYADLQPASLGEDERNIQRQAFAGMLWTKQFYHYNIEEWLQGDPSQPAPPPERKKGRNREWRHMNASNIISMPDKWEYPWFAAWDLAFHCIPLALVDSEFAKKQLDLLTREWFMHPNGQLPAYEWAFGDVNPPVHAWATWRVFEMDRQQ